MGLGFWAQKATPEEILAFLKEVTQPCLLETQQTLLWTGFRIMVSVHQGNGFPVYTLELFAKHADTSTQVYSEANAPNVLRRPRYERAPTPFDFLGFSR